MRVDREITIIFFYLFRFILKKFYKKRIPILMYHSISDKIEKNKESPYFITTTSPSVFKLHMKILKDNGFRGISLQEIDNYWNKKEKVVVITFDDGFEDFYTEAFPILKEYNFSATVFVPTAYIGSKGEKIFGWIPHLNWDQLCQLSKDNIEIGSHTVKHLILRNYPEEYIKKEIVESKSTIENHIKKPVYSFSYPFAFPFDNKKLTRFLEKTVMEAGYKFAVSTRIGLSKKKNRFYFMPRIPINNFDTEKFFISKIYGAYSWLSIVQYIYRNISILISPSKYNSLTIER